MLDFWLNRIKNTHNLEMDLSLERVKAVADRLRWPVRESIVITVAGTNGKGSTVAGLEAIYRQAGYQTGVFTSPILFRHNEYVRMNGKEVDDESFCAAFERIDKARGDITLTPFEFTALAAFDLFHKMKLDVWILEVGLGGRYDAVNIIDADVAVVTSIDLDHTAILGDTREKIAYEKAGIFRKNKPVVYGDLDPPNSLIDYAKKLNAPVFYQGQQFGFEKKSEQWRWWHEKKILNDLPLPRLALQNMAIVLMVIELLQEKLPATEGMIKTALSSVSLPGRIQVLPGNPTQIYDVSHNPAAAKWLAIFLQENVCDGKTTAVFSMLADKDIVGTLQVMSSVINEWFVASLSIPRGASQELLEKSFQQAQIKNVSYYDSIEEAYESALKNADEKDRIVAFGSFHTVSRIFARVD